MVLNSGGRGVIHGSPLTAKVPHQIPQNFEPSRKRAAQFFEVLDRELAARPFVAGERISVADISALCTIDFARMVDVAPAVELSHIARWYAAMSSRPSAVA